MIHWRYKAVALNFQAKIPTVIQPCILDYQPKSGQFLIPDLPGIHVELNDKGFSNFQKVVVKLL
jgi:hypothetical protein